MRSYLLLVSCFSFVLSLSAPQFVYAISPAGDIVCERYPKAYDCQVGRNKCSNCHIEGSTLNLFGQDVKAHVESQDGYQTYDLPDFLDDAFTALARISHKKTPAIQSNL